MAAGAGAARNERDYRVSHLLGKEVFDPAGIDFGRIQDIVIDMSDGDVRYAIISLNGDTALDQIRYYAIPARAFTLRNNNRLVMSVNNGAWRERSFPSDRWPDLRNPGYWSEVDHLSGFPAVQPTDAYFAHRASQVIGKKVQNVEGQALGVLRDIVIDMGAAKVRYAALDSEPGLARSGELFRFPISSFMFREDRQGNLMIAQPLVLDVEPVMLMSMQGFMSDRWPGVDEPGSRPVRNSRHGGGNSLGTS